MKMTQKTKRILSCFLCTGLIAAAAFTVGCNDEKNENSTSVSDSTGEAAEVVSVGEGNTKFEFAVVHKDGSEKLYNVSTDKKIVGEALTDNKIIEGEPGDYGLYVKSVDGEKLDFEEDGYYWSFYVNGEYAQAGVDMTEIKEGESYSFKAEKG